MLPLSATELLLEVVTLGVRVTWAGFRGCRTIVPKVPLVLGEKKYSVGDGEGD